MWKTALQIAVTNGYVEIAYILSFIPFLSREKTNKKCPVKMLPVELMIKTENMLII